MEHYTPLYVYYRLSVVMTLCMYFGHQQYLRCVTGSVH